VLRRSNLKSEDLAAFCVLIGMALTAVGAQNAIFRALALAVGAIAALLIVAHLLGWRR
jgi:hypothetical protein